ncbi:MAG TPA: hypothetical protein VL309_08840 [Vicinamibacterales bacterium]|jgi:hypothetical protein|nr:hypothetical protein [Vicinamibacterales bacterium]
MPSTTEPAYLAARLVAPRVKAYFSTHRAAMNGELAPPPDGAIIEALVDAAFWASLRREEGYSPKISLAFLPPEAAEHPLCFAEPLALEPRPLARLAPAVERPGVHLGVWRFDDDLQVWGTTRTLPSLCLVVEVISPGLLVVKSPRGEPAKFVNVAVLQGDRIKVLNESEARVPGCPEVVQSLLGFDAPGSWAETVNVFVQLAVSMRAHGRGGALLVVPPASEAWRESIVHPIPYAVSPPHRDLTDLLRVPHDERMRRWWQDALARAVDAIAGLTAVDGAAVITADGDVLAFGAKIVRRADRAQVEQVTLTEPIEGSEPAVVHPSQFGGTRHLSAAQFAHDQRDSVALVASQDGRFTVFKWSACDDVVHAHRVDALLL